MRGLRAAGETLLWLLLIGDLTLGSFAVAYGEAVYALVTIASVGLLGWAILRWRRGLVGLAPFASWIGSLPWAAGFGLVFIAFGFAAIVTGIAIAQVLWSRRHREHAGSDLLPTAQAWE